MSNLLKNELEQFAHIDIEANKFNHQKKEIEKDRIQTDYNRLQERKEELEALEMLDLDNEDPSVIEQIAKETEEYLTHAQKAKIFINNDFKGKVPYFPRNIILAAAETGVGKSTICANLAFHAISQGQRVLVLSNEESPGDIYNRVTCLFKNWTYVDHTSFTDEQRKEFAEMTVKLSKRLTIVGDKRVVTKDGKKKELVNLTTSVEGVEKVLNSILDKKNKFDLIIIDYYQNIDKSTTVPSASAYECQYRFCKFIDKYKNHSPASIVILAQLKANTKDLPFKDAIEGRKTIMNVASCVLRVNKDAEKRRTGFEFMKSRFNGCLGETVYVGFDKGKYVRYTNEFKLRVDNEILEKSLRTLPVNVQPTGLNEEE